MFPLQLIQIQVELGLFLFDELLPRPVVDGGDDVLGEVKHPLQVARGQVQQGAQAAGSGFGEPDVGDRGGQADVAHPFPAHLGPGDFHAAAVADHAAVADALILAAKALPVLGRAKEPLAEQAVLFRAQGAVVDGLRLGDLAVGPVDNLLRRGDGNADRVKVGGLRGFRPVLHPDH